MHRKLFLISFSFHFKGYALALLLIILNGCVSEAPHSQQSLIHSYPLSPSYRFHGNKRVLVGGCFDVLHAGHFDFLKKAKEQGDYLIIALEPDQKITVNKQQKLIHSQEMRAFNLAAIRYVDEIILLPSLKTYDDYQQMVEKIRPAIIAVTGDDPCIAYKIRQAQTTGAEVRIVNSLIGGFSSSAIRSKM